MKKKKQTKKSDERDLSEGEEWKLGNGSGKKKIRQNIQ